MLNVLQSITDFLAMIVDNVKNVISGTAQIIGLIGPSVEALNYIYAYIPGVLTVFAITGIGICIVFHIIGR